MLEYDRIDLSKGIGVKESDCSHECIICHYWYCLEIDFRFQLEVCTVCHDWMQETRSFNDVAIGSVEGNGSKIVFCRWVTMKP